jgi:2-polyprenyl-6-methoxyphenol hydroxylase-like FAD-dependent oxidoreductase
MHLRVIGSLEDPNQIVEYRDMAYDELGRPYNVVTGAMGPFSAESHAAVLDHLPASRRLSAGFLYWPWPEVESRGGGAAPCTDIEDSRGGTGIAIPPNGARALAGVGLPIARLIERGSRLRQYRFLDPSGRELSCGDLTKLWLGEEYPYFAVHRRRIYELFLEVLGDQPIEFRSTAEFEPGALTADRPVVARITGPGGTREETFDLVVGADGIRSAVRQTVAPSVTPRPLGWLTWRCVLDWDGADPHAQVVYSRRGGTFLYIPIGSAQVYVYAGCRHAPGAEAPKSGQGAAVAARFGGFGAPRSLLDAVTALPDSAFHVGPLEEVPHEELTSAGSGRAVLVGDALHACSPNMAQGVSLAAEDGAALADIVRRPDGAGSIPDRFWGRRLPRIRHVQELTRKRDHMVNKRAESALFQRVSNLVIRLRGVDRMQREAFGFLLENRA